MTEENIFGTDGIRDIGGEGFLTPASVDRLGSALSRFLEAEGYPDGKVIIARDPRISGPLIESQLSAALRREGKYPISLGVLPTPAVSLLAASGEGQMGVVLSASHNPPRYNGIKVVTASGRKLNVSEEVSISGFYRSAVEKYQGGEAPIDADPLAGERYLDLIHAQFGHDRFLDGLHVVLDCAHGATCHWAPEIFERAGARVETIHAEPDGNLINKDCGSIHPQKLVKKVLDSGAQLGVAFDGDGDRAILVDESGKVVDGDEAMAVWALALRDRGELNPAKIVCTVMSNAGMVAYLQEMGIEVLRAPVGDREVFEKMVATSAIIGGEQSGHIIDLRACPTGDGIRTGLALASRVTEQGIGLSQLCRDIPRFPQSLVGLEVSARPPLESLDLLSDAIDAGEKTLGDRGRILVRYSGTEKVLRILVEGPEEAENNDLLRSLIEAAHQQSTLGCILT